MKKGITPFRFFPCPVRMPPQFLLKKADDNGLKNAHLLEKVQLNAGICISRKKNWKKENR
jgi:hypothetical protein